MTEVLTVEQSLQLELQRIREDIRFQQFGDFKPDSLGWLALVPVWTESLAESVRFPTGGLSLDDFLAKAQKNRLCTRRTEQRLKGDGIRQFWVQKESLDGLLDYLKNEMGARWLQERSRCCSKPNRTIWTRSSSTPTRVCESSVSW